MVSKIFFQETLYRIDNWINEGSGFIVELIKSQYINISTYRPLSGSSYVKLPTELRNSKKGLISFKNNGQKCLLWCHIRYINSLKIHLVRITEEDKKLLIILIMMKLNFLRKKKIFARLKKRKIFVLIRFVTKTSSFFQFTFQIRHLKTRWIYCL